MRSLPRDRLADGRFTDGRFADGRLADGGAIRLTIGCFASPAWIAGGLVLLSLNCVELPGSVGSAFKSRLFVLEEVLLGKELTEGGADLLGPFVSTAFNSASLGADSSVGTLTDCDELSRLGSCGNAMADGLSDAEGSELFSKGNSLGSDGRSSGNVMLSVLLLAGNGDSAGGSVVN